MSLHFADCFVEFFHASVALCVLAVEVFTYMSLGHIL